MGQAELIRIISVSDKYSTKKELLEQYKETYGLSESSFNRTLSKLVNKGKILRLKPINKNRSYYTIK